MRHAGNRHERLAEEHHLPALYQEQQADPVVLAGGSWCRPLSGQGMGLGRDVIAVHQRKRELIRFQSHRLLCFHSPIFDTLLTSPSLQKEIRNPTLGQTELLQLGRGQCLCQEGQWSAGVSSKCQFGAGGPTGRKECSRRSCGFLPARWGGKTHAWLQGSGMMSSSSWM